MELIEGKYYRCKKTYQGSIEKTKFIIFKEGNFYKLHPKGFISGEGRHAVSLGENIQAFTEFFYLEPFDENTALHLNSLDSRPGSIGKFYTEGEGATVTPLSKYPKVMEVSDFPDFSSSLKRVVFMATKGRFFVWNNAKTIEDAEKELGVSSYKYAREVSPLIEVSKKEIAEWKGVSVDRINIID